MTRCIVYTAIHIAILFPIIEALHTHPFMSWHIMKGHNGEAYTADCANPFMQRDAEGRKPSSSVKCESLDNDIEDS